MDRREVVRESGQGRGGTVNNSGMLPRLAKVVDDPVGTAYDSVDKLGSGRVLAPIKVIDNVRIRLGQTSEVECSRRSQPVVHEHKGAMALTPRQESCRGVDTFVGDVTNQPNVAGLDEEVDQEVWQVVKVGLNVAEDVDDRLVRGGAGFTLFT